MKVRNVLEGWLAGRGGQVSLFPFAFLVSFEVAAKTRELWEKFDYLRALIEEAQAKMEEVRERTGEIDPVVYVRSEGEETDPDSVTLQLYARYRHDDSPCLTLTLKRDEGEIRTEDAARTLETIVCETGARVILDDEEEQWPLSLEEKKEDQSLGHLWIEPLGAITQILAELAGIDPEATDPELIAELEVHVAALCDAGEIGRLRALLRLFPVPEAVTDLIAGLVYENGYVTVTELNLRGLRPADFALIPFTILVNLLTRDEEASEALQLLLDEQTTKAITRLLSRDVFGLGPGSRLTLDRFFYSPLAKGWTDPGIFRDWLLEVEEQFTGAVGFEDWVPLWISGEEEPPSLWPGGGETFEERFAQIILLGVLTVEVDKEDAWLIGRVPGMKIEAHELSVVEETLSKFFTRSLGDSGAEVHLHPEVLSPANVYRQSLLHYRHFHLSAHLTLFAENAAAGDREVEISFNADWAGRLSIEISALVQHPGVSPLSHPVVIYRWEVLPEFEDLGECLMMIERVCAEMGLKVVSHLPEVPHGDGPSQ